MKSLIQQQISPPVPVQDFVKGTGKTLDPDADDQVDFLKLLNNSNSEAKRDREAKKNGDLSGAETYDDFLNKLEEQTKQLREPKNNLDKDDFLTLFVTQLQNQDPLSPEDSTEMASRLAQFNSLEQMLNVNTTLQKMLSSQNQSRSVGMVNYIGKEITVSGGRVKFKDGEPLNSSTFSLARPASNSTLEIRDQSGTMILSKQLGTLQEGEHDFEWDGKNGKGEKVGGGTFTYSIVAKGVNDDEIPVAIDTKTKITGVDIKSEDGGLYTPLGIVALDDIKSIGDIGFGAAKDKLADPASGAQPGQMVDPSKATNLSPEQQIQAVAQKLSQEANAAKAAGQAPVQQAPQAPQAPQVPQAAVKAVEAKETEKASKPKADEAQKPKEPTTAKADKPATPVQQPAAEKPASEKIPG